MCQSCLGHLSNSCQRRKCSYTARTSCQRTQAPRSTLSYVDPLPRDYASSLCPNTEPQSVDGDCSQCRDNNDFDCVGARGYRAIPPCEGGGYNPTCDIPNYSSESAQPPLYYEDLMSWNLEHSNKQSRLLPIGPPLSIPAGRY